MLDEKVTHQQWLEKSSLLNLEISYKRIMVDFDCNSRQIMYLLDCLFDEEELMPHL